MSASTLQETLQTEFPLIDSSLLAALLLDYQEPNQAQNHSSLQSLRDLLTQLSLDTHASESSDELSSHHIDTQTSSSSQKLDSEDPEDNRESEHSNGTQDDTTSTSGGSVSISMTSISSVSASSSPLEFLNILFPQLSTQIINQALEECSYNDQPSAEAFTLDNEPKVDNLDFNMSTVVDHLLSLEYIQDLTERGLEEEDPLEEEQNAWKIAKPSGKNYHHQTPKKQFKKPVNKIAFVDIRQRRYKPPVNNNNDSPNGVSRPFASDPWTRLTSIATHLSDLLKPVPAGFFQSYFHAPQSSINSKTGWKVEGDALRNALSDLIKKRYSSDKLQAIEASPKLASSIDVLRNIILDPGSDDSLTLDGEQFLELESDAKLCILAANGNLDVALDLLWLLKELDEAFVNGTGIAHLQPIHTQSQSPFDLDTNKLIPVQPPPPTLPSISIKSRPPDPATPKSRGSSWTTVQRRSQKPISPHVDFIPAYSNSTPRIRQPIRGGGNRFGKGGKGDVGELDHDLAWYRERRKEFMHEASRHWKSGTTKNRGGEIAFYYAEKARTYQEKEHLKALEIARKAVNEKRYKSNESDTLDLHGLTIYEACVIVKEAVEAFDPSTTRPLKVITGRGRHSIDNVSVLGPAVKDMLENEGYKVSTWDGGLSVRGR
ncbi:hypothetical protein Clacol_005731 [Clathrus columnatus]|uniref:Smr domain-containing protein n=1 Tax=Clathrus columnatus TaxID=1419009 RepID=A0AAV5AED9_9AGAM|nr:hypothetical protein Clacol_005731 [Clathrus columnatus]